MGDVVVLGDVVLDVVSHPFATPSVITGGSGQMLATAKMIGGQRTIDAMGPDPQNITWRGRWRTGSSAGFNDTMIAMAEAGQPVPCTWGEYFFMVMIARYTYEYEAWFEIPYSVEVVVLPDLPDASGSSSLDDIAGQDMDTAQGAGNFQ